MSEIGIYAGGYQRVRDYAEFLDRLLLDLKSGVGANEETIEPVINLLEALQKDNIAPPSVRLLGLRWMQRSGMLPARVAGIVSELGKRAFTPQTIADLESLAVVLDQERADMRQRLRGV